jgi:hypothetical protein
MFRRNDGQFLSVWRHISVDRDLHENKHSGFCTKWGVLLIACYLRRTLIHKIS